LKEMREDTDEGDVRAVACATVSAMFYAAALDAYTFGNLPDIDEEVS
jgi:hypothetical protein